MPLWLIKSLIALAFFPGLLVGVGLLVLGAAYLQTKEEQENGEGA